MKAWLMVEDWNNVLEAETTDQKAEEFQKTFFDKFSQYFPRKQIKIANDDQPWITDELKKLDRKKKRIYRKTRRSEKWKVLDKQFKKKVKESKSNFYKNMVADLKEKDPKQWYSMVKRIASYENKNEQINVEEINNLSDIVQIELIADEFSKIPNEYTPLHSDDNVYPSFEIRDIPQFKEATVWKKLVSMKVKASTRKGDVPAKLFKIIAAYIAEPLTNIFNSSIKSGDYPKNWKHKIATPIPKVHPLLKITDLRNISGLMNCDKVMESLLADLIVSDMEPYLDPSQYGNRKGKSINHYLIKMINRILTALDNNSRREMFAVVANLIDWSKAFPRQCPKLGVESFINNGVRPALIPILTSFFQGRQMSVKWHGHDSKPRNFPGGGPAGATLGLLEYLSQSNDSANCVNPEDRFKFVDNLTSYILM